MLSSWRERRLEDLLAAFRLDGIPERPFPNDGWSGATLTSLSRGGDRFVLKRTSLEQDWIARATHDAHLREGVVASGVLRFEAPIISPYLGAAAAGRGVAILMPDLSAALIPWDDPDASSAIDPETLDRVLDVVASLHAMSAMPAMGAEPGISDPDGRSSIPWTPLAERLTMLGRPSATRLHDAGVAAGDRFLSGWAAFDRRVPTAASSLIHDLATDPGPLVAALDRLPAGLLHGDLKLANVALLDDGAAALIDWQMVMHAPVAVDLGWFLVANSGSLPALPEVVLDRYFETAVRNGSVPIGDREAQVDLTAIVGLLLRGWRKGLDVEDAAILPSGATAAYDLAWWADRAVEAARRRL